jgi:hypothetical protein
LSCNSEENIKKWNDLLLSKKEKEKEEEKSNK